MATSSFSSAVLRSKFRGCLLGALLGDCVGAPFEDNILVEKKILKKYLTNFMSDEFTEELPHTDDTSMTLSVASSLIDKEKIDAKDMAKKFVDGFYTPPKRRYGRHVVLVFKALRESDYNDVFLPAKLQFDGSGSYGNGAAMRIAPIALFGNSKGEQFIMNAAEECSRITHTHQNGYNGAILQCLAINAALGLDSSKALNPVEFINNLEEKMEEIETEDMKKPYCESLKRIKKYLQNRKDVSAEEIAKNIGHDVTALASVPAAIYSFLRGMKPIKDYKSSNPFLRTIYFAISIGGDTDTIASMAGSIAGAYYGADVIPEVLQKKCESVDEVIKVADKLFDLTQKKE